MAEEQRRAEVPQDVKDKFREALERKSANGHRTADGGENTGAVHASETAGPMQRNFRRKSG